MHIEKSTKMEDHKITAKLEPFKLYGVVERHKYCHLKKIDSNLDYVVA